MDSVNQRTQLVGQNRLELLLFRLDGEAALRHQRVQGAGSAAMPN
jgi:chemotaxis signal transduction protein